MKKVTSAVPVAARHVVLQRNEHKNISNKVMACKVDWALRESEARAVGAAEVLTM
jgi:hypothetical protein